MDTIENSKKYKAKIVLAGFKKIVVDVKGEPLVLENNNFLKLFIITAVKLRPLGRRYKA